MRDGNHETLRERVYEYTRRGILSGRFSAEQRLSAAQISEQCGVSLSVTREALTGLSSQGLVESASGRGFRVASLSASTFAKVIDVRCGTEPLALSMAITEGDSAWESGIKEAFDDLSVALEDPDWRSNDAWNDAHTHFHHALISACPVTSLVDYCMSLRDVSTMHRMRTVRIQPTVERNFAEEHRELRDATLARDAPFASALLIAHYRRALDIPHPEDR